MRIGQIYICYKFAQSGRTPLKSIARFQLIKLRNQLVPQWEIISPHETANQWDNRSSWQQ